MDERTITRFVACGWIAAAAAGVLTIVLIALGPLTKLSLLDAAFLLGLAYGIRRGSRICAVLALVYHIANRALVYAHIPHVSAGIVAGDMVFATLYVLGVIGTFAAHSRIARADSAAPVRAGDRSA